MCPVSSIYMAPLMKPTVYGMIYDFHLSIPPSYAGGSCSKVVLSLLILENLQFVVLLL